ncbi:hypothetical protein QTV49_004595 [Vibrio vulnificus]|nr:hypothetical protein [Vibrio vulnificus]
MNTTTNNNSKMKNEMAFTLSKERHNEIISSFKAFLKNKDNHPKKDEVYGTKYNFRITLSHFVLYAIIRNQDPAATSHDPENSEKYINAISGLRSLMRNYKPESVSWGFKTFGEAFGITEVELNGVLTSYFK